MPALTRRSLHILATLALVLSACDPAEPTTPATPIATSLCDVLRKPSAYDGKHIVVTAEVLADMHLIVLVDRRCGDSRGVVFSPYLSDPSQPNPLNAILRRGCTGTIDKSITGTWSGLFHYDPYAEPGSDRFPRRLELTGMEDVVSRPRPDGPSCPFNE